MKKSLLLAGLSATLVSFGQMTTVTNASMLGGSCDCWQVTPDLNNQKGAIWSPGTIDMSNTFDMTFNIYAGDADMSADGMVFVIQQNPSGIGDYGNTMAYKDIAPLNTPAISANSFAIEIDGYNNSPSVVTDVASDHLGISSNNSNEHNLGGPYNISNIENGAYHTFRVVWAPSFDLLSVFLDGAFMFSYNGDIVADIFMGNPNVYFGWTAASGGGGLNNEHRVCMYRNAAFTADATSVCSGTAVAFDENATSDLNNITSYSWDFGDGSAVETTQNASHTYAASGTYTTTLTIEDISGCTDFATVDITVLPDLNVNVAGTDVTCFGDVDGQATATSTTGTGPYTYLWDDAATQTTQTATGLVPGTYNVTVTDDLGCSGNGTVTINEPALFTVSLIRSDATCFDSNDGFATVVTDNGIAPFTFDWDDPADQNTQTASNLAPGGYNVIVTDDNGCTATTFVSIGAPTEMFITGSVTHDNGTSNGTIDATITGGTPPYVTTAWSNSATTEDVTGLATGSYTLTVTDDNGCVKDTTFVVPSSVGLADLNAIGFEIYPNPTTGVLNVNGAGSYAIVITDAAGRIVMNTTANGLATIDLSAFERGVYFVEVEKDEVKYTTRVIRQ